MATYIPNLTDVFPEPSLNKSDFGFFDSMLRRKQAQYDEGVSKAMSARDMIRNAPLSDFANIEARDKYLKEADQALAKISSADFSLPQNVSAAMNIFSPFWEDPVLMRDMQLTKQLNGSLSTLMSWRDSKDEKVRAMYNGTAVQYVMNDMERLRNANRDPENYKSVEGRRAIPFTNIEDYLNKKAKDEGLEIKYDDPSNGPYLVQTVNGERSLKKYAAWAKSQLGSNFNEQFRVIGTVESEERAKNIRRINPTLNNEQISDAIANDMIGELESGYNRRKKELDVDIARVESLIGDVAKTNDPSNKNLFENLVKERSKLSADKATLEEEYKYFNQNEKAVKLAEIKLNPTLYFSTLAKQRTIDGWAVGKASNNSVTVKENTAFTAAENLRLRAAELAFNQLKADREYEQVLWERNNPKPTASKGTGTGNNTGSGKTGNNQSDPEVVGEDSENSLIYKGFSNIDITRNAPTALEVFNRIQEQDFMESFDMIFDQRGILGLTKNLDLNDEEIAHIATAMKQEIISLRPENKDYSFTKEQLEAVKKLEKGLAANAGVIAAGATKISGPFSLRNAIIAYAKDHFTTKNNLIKEGNNVAFDEKEFEMMMRYKFAVEKLDRYTANENRRQELLKKNVIDNPEYQSLLVDRGNGNKSMVTLSDLAKDMPTLELVSRADGSIRKLSKADLAKLFSDGKLAQSEMGDFVLDGVAYQINKFNDQTGYFEPTRNWNNLYNDVLLIKYGESSEFSKLLNKASNSVVPDLLMYQNQTGRQGSLWRLYFMKNKSMAQGDKAALIIDQAMSGSNSDIYNSDGTQASTDDMQAIRTLLSSEENMEKYISAEYIPQGKDGKRTIRIAVSAPISGESKETIAGKSLTNLSSKVFDVVIKDGATTPALDNLPRSSGYQIFDMITRGKVFKSDPVIEASGFKFTLTPNVLSSSGSPDVSPSYVTLDMEYMVYENKKDPATGEMKLTPKMEKISETINIQGENAQSPDEIIMSLYQLYYKNAQANNERISQYKKQQEAAVNSGSPSAYDYKSELRKLGLSNLIK